MTKTQCILLGNLKDRYEEISGIKTTNDAMSCLGIYVGHNKTQCYKLKWIKIHEICKGSSSHGKKENWQSLVNHV